MTATRILYLVPGALSTGRGAAELERRRSLLQSWAAPGTEVSIAENPDGPASIESAVEEYLAIPGALACGLRAESAGYDGIVLGCFGDPGLDGFRELLSIPVVGPCEASMHVAAMLGSRFGIVTAGESLRTPLERLIRAAGLDSRAVAVSACEVPVLELGPESHQAILDACGRSLDSGADTIVLGCMSMSFLGVAEQLADELGVPVINPARTALKVAELLANTNLTASRRAYHKPPKQTALHQDASLPAAEPA